MRERSKHSAQVWGLLTHVRLAHGQLREAEKSIWKSLRIDPDNAQCWIGLASVNNRLLASTVCKIVEGGDTAFLKRERRYAIQE
jgi:Tfp pilus assembly protein PilF